MSVLPEKRHSVSNDGVTCQAIFGDTAASTPEAAPFRSSRTSLIPKTKLVTHFNPAAGHQVPPYISSALAPTIAHFDLPDFSGRQAAHSSARLLLASHGIVELWFGMRRGCGLRRYASRTRTGGTRNICWICCARIDAPATAAHPASPGLAPKSVETAEWQSKRRTELRKQR